MAQFINAINSEFVWGIVIGVLLSIIVTIANMQLSKRERRQTVAAFCQDLIGSICDLIQNLEDNRNRNRVIDHEFLDTIIAEITVYGRNREHLTVLNDTTLRKDVRIFFTEVAAVLTRIKWRLGQFQNNWELKDRETDANKRRSLEQLANDFLAAAHRDCDILRDLRLRRNDLDTRLDILSKRLF